MTVERKEDPSNLAFSNGDLLSEAANGRFLSMTFGGSLHGNSFLSLSSSIQIVSHFPSDTPEEDDAICGSEDRAAAEEEKESKRRRNEALKTSAISEMDPEKWPFQQGAKNLISRAKF